MDRSPEAHEAALRALIPPRPCEVVDLASAALRRARLSRTIVARENQPAFDNSQMDGYAVERTDAHTAAAGPTIPAGTNPATLYPHGLTGRAAPIMTGAAIPSGTRAIVAVERCRPPRFVAAGDKISFPAAPEGEFIRRAGSDIRAGDVLAEAGAQITPALYAALVAQGITEVEVEAQARIIIVSGGAEVTSSAKTGPATVRDTNGPMLEILAHHADIDVAARITTNDDPDRLRADLTDAIDRYRPDAIVTSGGISHGAFEVVRLVLDTGWFGHVAQQPGGPQGLSMFDGVPVISLPGNPISTLVSFRLYVAPVLGNAPEPVRVPLAEPLQGIDAKEQFLRGVIVDGRAKPVGDAGSHLLAQAAPATCLIRMPAGANCAAGDVVVVYPLD
ncbi:molybdopterin molybdotransferase MoeA [Corynebacterium sp. LK2510]|uniref:molybdopterin molybdotransferase MoeA n=1 Tax=Corynebacterium sp. LK2510 TaxID=3110472 RepID=UPI0034CDA94E